MAPKVKTHCKNGHEFTEENSYWSLSSPDRAKPSRKCRTCRNDKARKWSADHYEVQVRERAQVCRKGHDLNDNPIVRKNGQRHCRVCNNEREKNRQRIGSRGRWLKQTYGITEPQFDRMAADQGNVCAICKQIEPRGLRVDHDHSTGKVRGLLCHHCNVALGHFKDDEGRLKAAIEYLRFSE